MRTSYDDSPSFYLDHPASEIFETLDTVIEAGQMGKITGLSSRGEMPLNPDFYKGLKRALLECLEPAAGQTIGQYRQELRTIRLSRDKDHRSVLMHYSKHLDGFLVAAPHFAKQLRRTPRTTRWTKASDSVDELIQELMHDR